MFGTSSHNNKSVPDVPTTLGRWATRSSVVYLGLAPLASHPMSSQSQGGGRSCSISQVGRIDELDCSVGSRQVSRPTSPISPPQCHTFKQRDVLKGMEPGLGLDGGTQGGRQAQGSTPYPYPGWGRVRWTLDGTGPRTRGQEKGNRTGDRPARRSPGSFGRFPVPFLLLPAPSFHVRHVVGPSAPLSLYW